jgi:hypothetical protein
MLELQAVEFEATQRLSECIWADGVGVVICRSFRRIVHGLFAGRLGDVDYFCTYSVGRGGPIERETVARGDSSRCY